MIFVSSNLYTGRLVFAIVLSNVFKMNENSWGKTREKERKREAMRRVRWSEKERKYWHYKYMEMSCPSFISILLAECAVAGVFLLIAGVSINP